MKLRIGISLVLTCISITLFAQTPLSGTYTIAPTGGDFLSFNEAVDSLKANGISSSVTFNVASGTYDETFEIDSIGGTSETATINFIGEDVATTIIESTTSTNIPTLELTTCSYVHFQNLTINYGQNQSGSQNILIQEGGKQISFKNCIIDATEGGILYNIFIEDAESIEFDSCYFEGTANSAFRHFQIESSAQILFTNCELNDGGFYMVLVRETSLINNRIFFNGGGFRAACVLSSCRDYYLEKNIIFDYSNRLTALYIAENGQGDIGDHTTMPVLKNNAFMGLRGLEIHDTDSIQLIHNSCIGSYTGLLLIARDVEGQIYAENNLFAGNDLGAFGINGTFESLNFDYNAYVTDTVLHPVGYVTDTNGTLTFSDFTLYQTTYPDRDQHSRLVNPSYLATDDYHIYSSTEFHFGRNDLGITEDQEGDPRGLFGDAVDVGADEFSGYVGNIFKVSGRLFFDRNGNGIQDGNEYGLSNKQVYQSLDDVTTLTDNNGDYYFYTIDGSSYTISPESATGFSTSPTDSTIMAGAYNTDSVNFAYQIVEEIPEIEIDFVTGFKRCARTINGYISYENTGSVEGDITIKLTPSADFTLESAEPTWNSELDGAYYWDIEGLTISESGVIRLQITMPGLESIGVEQTTLLSTENADSTLVEKTYVDEVACSYDPNDKSVSPAGFGEDNLVLKTDSLEYLIRFQNTGNDTAFDIRIQDQLSTELDLSTFELISASYQVRTELNKATNQLIFYFDDIQLVDSVANEPDSHGFVKYRIKAKEDILDSTEILNTAYIYFDFNPPIITNTVSSMMVDEIPQEFVTGLPSSSDASFVIYPNPTEGLINIKTPNSNPVFLEVISLDGRTVHQHHYANTNIKLDMSLLPPSIYIIKVQGEGYQVQERIVVR